ncbi:DNA-binding transcriptional regulator, LysR family [Roseovarius marisflavi]|uniref:DNA-binding transcriptional regulator, LysR family n=1 Tax=Roseovarius marisflavi TaxID=1054996 RepID=A0A1M6XAP8_9RHOB|nr:LysR family transcriptional regulator [Roseovarius marisflavi]SHL03008.1 DNA-binding transcriptional regulator, LysR family [Roseovarius marisflavi]
MLNAQWLETFTVLCDIGHFTRAANRLGMTQPGVSQHLRKLEDQVGQALISRQGKRFSVTPAGEAVLALGRARRIEEKALQETILRDDPAVGRVVVGCSGSFAMVLYSHLFAAMRASPDLTIHLEATPQDSVLSGVLEGRFDIGIVDHKPRQPRLDAQYLGKEELCLVLPPDAVTSPISFEALEGLGFVAHPDGFTYAEELFSLNFPDQFKGAQHLRIRTFVNQISQIPAPVAHGIGYTLLPRSGVISYPGKDKLCVLRLPKSHHHDLWMIFQRGRALPARVARISDMIKSITSDLEAGG